MFYSTCEDNTERNQTGRADSNEHICSSLPVFVAHLAESVIPGTYCYKVMMNAVL